MSRVHGGVGRDCMVVEFVGWLFTISSLQNVVPSDFATALILQAAKGDKQASSIKKQAQ